MNKSKILTHKAQQVIHKRIGNRKLTQQDSNYLSRFVRPKLREIATLDAKSLLKRLEYSPKIRAIERRIQRLVLTLVPHVDAIILCGSAIQTNYKDYEDIDLIVATKSVLKNVEKRECLKKVIEAGEKHGLALDPQIYSKKSILNQYGSSPSLIYQLKDSKVIYGAMQIPSNISLSILDLKMKLDWSEGLDINSDPCELYQAIRNALLVSLLLNKTIDNTRLQQSVADILGNDLLQKLKKNQAAREEKKLVLACLSLLTDYLENELNKKKWEKIEFVNH